MLRTSKLTDYGTIVMAYLARQPERVHAANEIAAEVRVALPTVTKVLKVLAREGLLTSQRGTKGGYSLALAPGDISLARIITAMEGPIGLTECGTAPGRCNQEPWCGIRGNWQFINQVVLDALERVSLAEMSAPGGAHVDAPQPVPVSITRRLKPQAA